MPNIMGLGWSIRLLQRSIYDRMSRRGWAYVASPPLLERVTATPYEECDEAKVVSLQMLSWYLVKEGVQTVNTSKQISESECIRGCSV